MSEPINDPAPDPETNAVDSDDQSLEDRLNGLWLNGLRICVLRRRFFNRG